MLYRKWTKRVRERKLFYVFWCVFPVSYQYHTVSYRLCAYVLYHNNNRCFLTHDKPFAVIFSSVLCCCTLPTFIWYNICNFSIFIRCISSFNSFQFNSCLQIQSEKKMYSGFFKKHIF